MARPAVPPLAPGWLRRLLAPALLLLLAAGCMTPAPHAQPSSGGEPPPIEPPARVGKIGMLAGTVTLADLASGDSGVATLNWPITSGHRLSTAPGSRAEVRIGSLAVRLDGDSMVDFNRVDDERVQLVVQAGSVALRVRSRELLRELDVLTPRERIMLEDVGRYRVDVDRVAGLTAVTTLVGQARITGTGGRVVFTVASGERGELATAPATSFRLVNPAADAFDDWVAARDRRDDVVASAQYVSRETTGIEVLDQYGSWRVVPTYGTVWFPASVPPGWAPFRHGRWSYVTPWGWTWIDDAPWGFAPSHYGRWVLVGGVWGWHPGLYVARPVYAPALVGWYGSPGLNISIRVGAPVGWFPLGYGEVYVPPWRYSHRYWYGVNRPHVTHITPITVINPPPRYLYQAPGTATWASHNAVVRQQPIQRVVRDAPAAPMPAPASVAPPMPTPAGIAKRIVPVSGDGGPAGGAPAISPERPGAPPVRPVMPPAVPTQTPAVPAPPTAPVAVPPGDVTPPPAVRMPPSTRGAVPAGERNPDPRPTVTAPDAAPALPGGAAPPLPPVQRPPEFVTRPRAPVQETPLPRATPSPARTAPPPVAPPAPPSVPPPAPLQANVPTAPKQGRDDGPTAPGASRGGGKVMRDN